MTRLFKTNSNYRNEFTRPPKETLLDKIPDDPISSLPKWGLSVETIKRFGKCRCGSRHPQTLRQVVKSLRNSIAHSRFDPIHKGGKIVGFDFNDESGFSASIQLSEMRSFVEILAGHLEEQLQEK